MAENKTEGAGLDVFFAAARAERIEMPVGLAERMRADAATVQAGFARPQFSPQPVRAPGLVRQLWSALGGWPALSGMAAACAAGVWLGVSPPNFLPDPVGLMVQGQQSDLDILDSYALSTVLPEDS